MQILTKLFRKLFCSANAMRLDAYREQVAAINNLDAELSKLSDSDLGARTITFRKQIAEGGSGDELLVPAFATVRETARRVLGQYHYDVQLIGGMALHDGCIAEMRTGEGKTLVATLAVYLTALTNKCVHIVTVNDYLAQRDAMWMGKIYDFLGLTVGTITNTMNEDDRKKAYGCDVVYGSNNEFGFDYLRDSLRYDFEQMLQGPRDFAIIDEVDSILIDEARTPLIISGQCDDSVSLYSAINELVRKLKRDEDFEVDEKQSSINFTDSGLDKLESSLIKLNMLKSSNIYDVENISALHHITQGVKAHVLFKKDRDYIVRNGAVLIIDEFTGRIAPGRRYSDGMHQALEAKEHVQIQPESQTLASITFQNYFRSYDKLAGMTGTATTEAKEFADIYALDVVEIPTNLPIKRTDEDDDVYRTDKEKKQAILRLIEDCKSRQQPVLVGTTSIAKSEEIANMLSAKGWTKLDLTKPETLDSLYTRSPDAKLFTILNARYHEQEASIIAQAGFPGAVTIATNMAGRGTDIQLGGNEERRINSELSKISDEQQRQDKLIAIKEDTAKLKNMVIQAGGLYVVGSERHESRRIDNQLRGRSGRQGDPGKSKFFLSLQDDLMRIFGSEQIDTILSKSGLPEGEAISHRWVSKALETAQRKIEERNFSLRKNLLSFDNVSNDQRKIIFRHRNEVLKGNETNIDEKCRHIVKASLEELVDECVGTNSYLEEWQAEDLSNKLSNLTALSLDIKKWLDEDRITTTELKARIVAAAYQAMDNYFELFGASSLCEIEKAILLNTIDGAWREQIATLDRLREVIGLRGYAQRDPLQEYRIEAFNLFSNMLIQLQKRITAHVMQLHTTKYQVLHIAPETKVSSNRNDVTKIFPEQQAEIAKTPDGSPSSKIRRNAKCYCGSGKKYKQCHGKPGLIIKHH